MSNGKAALLNAYKVIMKDEQVTNGTILVTSITLIRGRYGADVLLLDTTLPVGVYPFKGNAYVTMKIARDQGEAYVATHFPGVPFTVTVVDYSKNT